MAIVGIDKLSLLDYEDKVSVVLFAQACNMRCPFCHNGAAVLGASKQDEIDFDEILAFLKTRTGLVDAVVFSGGEPTLLEELLDEGLLDYVAMDIKNCPNLYAETCGLKFINVDNIKKSISLIINKAKDYEFRTTLVKEFHEKMDYETFLNSIKGAKRLFLQKFVDRDGCIKKGLHEVDVVEASKLRDYLSSEIPEVNLRGY